MEIGVVGGGVVGRATARTWLEHCDEVRVYDCVSERSTHSRFDVQHCCDIIFVCLPEDQLDTWFSGLSGGREKRLNWVLKSTVSIGTTRRLRDQYHLHNLCHSPEFLTTRCAVTDAQMPARNIIGFPLESDKEGVELDSCGMRLWQLYERRFPGVPVYRMRSDESETVKLAVNSFFAVKVAFFNEVRTLCDAMKLDWETVRTGIISDGRICPSHTQVPGPDGKQGYGGSCLPKDISHLLKCMEGAGLFDPYNPEDLKFYSVCSAARERNKLYRREI